MTLITSFRKSLILGALVAQAAGATTIIQSSGNSAASVPLGYYAPYAQYGMTPIVYAVEWTQTSNYVDLDVFANLFTPGSAGTVNYELVTNIGAGTSFAADGIIRGSATTPANPADVDLFHLNALAAGTYYLVLDSSVPNTSWQYNYPFQTNLATDTGVSYLGGQWATGGSINTSYTAASNFSGVGYPVEFRVTGTVATPEPTSFALSGLALVGISWMLRRMERRRRM